MKVAIGAPSVFHHIYDYKDKAKCHQACCNSSIRSKRTSERNMLQEEEDEREEHVATEPIEAEVPTISVDHICVE